MHKTLSLTARFIAALTAISFTLVPLAHADRKRGYHDRGYERHESRQHYSRRGDNYRHRSRHETRRHDRYAEPRRRYSSSRHYYAPPRHHYAPPRRTVVVRHAPPRFYYPPPRTTVRITHGFSYGPYYYSGYSPRWRIGHHYSYAPSRTVYITDYHRHGLYAPPHGYHWVRDRDRGDAILASAATGAIIGLVVGALIAD